MKKNIVVIPSRNNINSEYILKDSIFKVGKVTSVDGRFIKITVDKSKNTSYLLYKGKLLKNLSVGSYVKIIKGFIKIIGKIEEEYINEDIYSFKKSYDKNRHVLRSGKYSKTLQRKRYGSEKEKINRILSIRLLGFFENQEFKKGIKELPLIDNECFLLEKKEFEDVHNFIRDKDTPVTIGRLSLEKGQSISVGVNNLFASHIGIFGNTGSGKSYTLAKIYRELFKQYKDKEKFKENSQFLLIDFNGEYIKEDVIIEKIYKNRFELSTREQEGKHKFPITRETINDHTFWTIFLTATDKTQAPFLKRTLKKKDIDNNYSRIENIIRDVLTNEDRKIDKGVIYNFLEDVKSFLEIDINIGLLRNNLKYHSTNNTYYVLKDDSELDRPDNRYYSNNEPEEVLKKVKDYLGDGDNIFKVKNNLSDLQKKNLKIIYHYYNEIVRGFANQEHLAPLIKRLDKRVGDLEKVIEITDDRLTSFFTVISLREVNIDMKKILPLLICKQLYDNKKKNNEKEKSLHFIIDEAHNILSYSSERESEIWRDYRLETFEEIIKEGRKFGVFLTVASQRPADISTTIISQLHNYFLHRLINNKDILAVEKTISYLDKVSFD
ncbi:MAG: ATP-binding protein, partial [Bdellovibrionales bacterium]|nr:ATP-binding protein [Bdellovibrionales bacterium]